jgi:hypothetical protein
MKFVRGNPPPAARARIFVVPVKSHFTIREEAPSKPRFVRRAPVAEPVEVAVITATSQGESEEPFLKPITKARLMARR